MTLQLIRVVLLFALPMFLQNCKHEVGNLSECKQNVANYYESGAYELDLEEALKPAYSALKDSYPENAAVVFDVDETILSNYNYIKSIDFGYEKDLWDVYLEESNAEPIDKTVELYKKAVESGLSVVFLTARTSESCKDTYDNLVNSGITEFDTLICKGPEFQNSHSHFKETERERLVKAGYDIVMCVGDQETDLAGENTGVKIKLPNKMYKTK